MNLIDIYNKHICRTNRFNYRILTCPVCNGEGQIYISLSSSNNKDIFKCFVQCETCGLKTTNVSTNDQEQLEELKVEAIRIWNHHPKAQIIWK